MDFKPPAIEKSKEFTWRALFLVTAVITFASQRSSILCAATVEDDTYSVYDEVIETAYLGPETVEVIIQSQTTTNFSTEISRDPEKESRLINEDFSSLGLGADTLASYFSRNKDGHTVENHFKVRVPSVIVTRKELDDLGKSGNLKKFWRGFYRKYPHARGLMAFSDVGFNSKRDQAFLYVQFTSCSLCGRGEYVFLVKQNSSWHVMKEMTIWTS